MEKKMSVRVNLNCHLKPDNVAVLLPFLEQNLANVRQFEGCISVVVYFDKAKTEMLLEEEWLSIEHHKAYIKHIEASGVFADLAAFLASEPTINYFYKEKV